MNIPAHLWEQWLLTEPDAYNVSPYASHETLQRYATGLRHGLHISIPNGLEHLLPQIVIKRCIVGALLLLCFIPQEELLLPSVLDTPAPPLNRIGMNRLKNEVHFGFHTWE